MFGLRRSPADLDAELDSHLRLHIDDLVRSGVSPADARRMARLSLGSIEAVRETYRDQDSAPLLRTARETVHQARRAVTRHPAFSAAVIATLGISVGLTASLTGVVDALLFRPPDHVVAPDRLVRVTTANNYPQYERLAAHSRTLDVAAVTRRTLSLGSGDTARAIETQCVTASYFPLMGATLAAGRNFSPDEDAPGAPTVVILAHHLWQQAFGGRADAIGTTVQVAGAMHTIIGVAPPAFRGLELTAVDAWILIAASPGECSLTGVSNLYSTSGSWLATVGRLHDDVGLDRTIAPPRPGWAPVDRPILLCRLTPRCRYSRNPPRRWERFR
jgi:hypothetical protein